MDQLRALFMETEWIHQNDPKNRLIFSPFIEGLCQYLTAVNAYNFEREKKYLLLSLDKTAIHLLSFQMQSAKELIAVSKKLAASDFLLVPTDLGDAATMDISDLDRLIYNKVKEIIIRQVSNGMQRKRLYKKGGFKLKKGSKKITRRQHNNMEAAAQPLFSVTKLRRIINEIIDILCGIMFEVSILIDLRSIDCIEQHAVWLGQGQAVARNDALFGRIQRNFKGTDLWCLDERFIDWYERQELCQSSSL